MSGGGLIDGWLGVSAGTAPGVALDDGFAPVGVALGIGLGLALGTRSEEALAIQSGFCAVASAALIGFDVAVVADDATADVFDPALVGVRNCDAGSFFCAPVWLFAGTPIKSLSCPRDFSAVAVVKKSLPFLNVAAANPSPGASCAPEVAAPEMAPLDVPACECP
jgi:hypothetical protein